LGKINSAFIGNINAKTDEKGRVFIPAAFRKILQSSGEERLILRKDVYKDCLILYPETVWKEKLNKLREDLDEWDEEQQDLFRQFLLLVEILEPDSNGRVLIPKKYLQMANISGTVCFLGINDAIELWNPDSLFKSMMNPENMKSGVKKFLARNRQKRESD
jgi:MraZ protein